MIIVNEATCVGCGWCETFCPQNALKAWGVLEIIQERCDDCDACTKLCPTDSLKVIDTSTA